MCRRLRAVGSRCRPCSWSRLLTAIACGLLFGLSPIWRAVKTSVRDAIGSGRVARPSSAARWLAGVEITAAFVLAAGALLMLQSFTALTRTDLLFRSDRFLTVRLGAARRIAIATPAARARAGEQLLERVRAIARRRARDHLGAEHVRAIDVGRVPVAGRSRHRGQRALDGVATQHQSRSARRSRHSRSCAGRDLAATDTLDAPPVAILSETAAARLWPGQDAVGRQLRDRRRDDAADDGDRRGSRRASSRALSLQPGRRRVRAAARYLPAIRAAAERARHARHSNGR